MLGLMLCAAASAHARAPVVVAIAPPAAASAFADAIFAEAMRKVRAIRAATPDAAVRVELAAGTYRLTRPLAIGKAEAGAGELVLAARPGAAVTVSGAAVLDGGRPVVGAAGANGSPALPAGTLLFPADGRLRADFAAEAARGLSRPPQAAGLLLFQGRRMMHFARWPDAGYAAAIQVASPGDRAHGPVFAAPPDRAVLWRGQSGLWAGGYWGFDWAFETTAVTSVGRGGLVALAPRSTPSPARPYMRFFVYNAVSEIDRPGEYAFDPAAGRLFVLPYRPPAAAPVELARAPRLVTVEGARDVRFSAIAFEKARGDIFTIVDSERVVVADSFVGLAGGSGVVIRGGSDNRVVRTVVADVGETGVVLAGGDRRTLAPAHHMVLDSLVTRFGRLDRSYRPGVRLEGVGQEVRGSLIVDAPHAAIIFQGNDHRIIGNEITGVVRETSDAGAIYAYRDWTGRGNVIADNYLHDILPGRGVRPDVRGIYLDDQWSGTVIRGNLFYRVMRPVFIGGGRDNTVVGNVFVDNPGAAVHIDARGMSPAGVAAAGDPGSELRRRLTDVPYTSARYRRAYGALAGILADEPQAPKNNRVAQNIVLGGRSYEVSFEAVPYQHLEAMHAGAFARLAEPNPGSSPRPPALRLVTVADGGRLGAPFDLPLAAMDRRGALAHLRFIDRAADE